MFDSEEEKMEKFQKRLAIALDNPVIQKKLFSVLKGFNVEYASEHKAKEKSKIKKSEKSDSENFTEDKKLQQELLVAQNNISALEKEVAGLKNKNLSLTEALRNAELKQGESHNLIVRLTGQCEQDNLKIEELSTTNRDLAKQNKNLKQIADEFAKPLHYYSLYCSLPASAQKRFKSIINATTPLSFLLSAGDKDNLLALWDDIKYRIDKMPENEIQILIELLAFFIELINVNYKSPLFELMMQEKGKQFDEERHIRSVNCSKYQGKIDKVLLPGIWNYNKQEAERKSVVEY